MKEKINQFAKGIFKYETAFLEITPSNLQFEVEAGESYSGSFKVFNNAGSVVKGIVSTDCHYIELEETAFQGSDNEIRFTFGSTKFMPGEVVKGNIYVISDCGSSRMSFVATIGVPSCTVSSGKIKDLFHFTNLARENDEEAIALFKNKHFEDVFLYRDNANIALYRGLIAGTSKGIAMEEFLIAIHKKLPIQFNVDKNVFVYDECTEEFMEHVTLTKDTWGFGEIHVSSDAAFLIPEHKIIWTDNFAGNSYQLSFMVQPDKMVPGKNYGRITITTVRQKITLEVTAVKPGIKHVSVQKNINRQKTMYSLINLYLKFCMNRIDKNEYVSEVEKMVCTLEKDELSNITQLYRIHLGILDGRLDSVKNGLEYLAGIADKLKSTDKKAYCAYEYLNGLWAEDNEIKDECIRRVRECYMNDEHSWQILWFLIYLDPIYESDRRKYEDIVEQLQSGCHSPVFYFEICNILNESAGMLRELNPEMIECLHWGCVNKYVEKELALRYVYLAGRLKNFSRIILDDLIRIYEQYGEPEMLAAVCRTCMRGQLTNASAFKWYELGIAQNLKITDLYEYYMYSIDESQEIHLNKSVLLYFLYDNHLTVSKKAMLYAYVIKNREIDPETYAAYQSVIEEFSYEQLAAGRINENLAVIYEQYINDESMTDEIAAQLPVVMFSHEITCNNPDIVGVYVRHRELKNEEFVPLINGKATVRIFTEQARIFLADSLDNRYAMSIDYTSNKLLHLEYLADKCFDRNKSDKRLLLYIYDRIDHFQQVNGETVEILKNVANVPEVSEYQRCKVYSALLRYYYDNFEGELLDASLEQIDWAQVNASDREQFVEYCAVRHCYDKAMEGIMHYGYDNISEKRLLQIASGTFREVTTEEPRLTKLAWHIFRAGKFDENLLKYLSAFYNGSMVDMVQIWKAASGFGIDVKELEERIVAQIVFTEEIVPEAYDVFYSYYEDGTNKKLIVAVMKMFAYKYLVKNWIIPKKMFECFFNDVRVQENQTCLIAVLKYFSKQDNLTEEQINFSDYSINMLYDKGIVFPFYKDFYGKFPLPLHILDEHYVEYTANPEYEVRIHYLISSGHNEKEYITETMKNTFEGIRVKEFVMFQDEILQYYISEMRPDGEKITKSVSVHFDESMDNARASSRYHMLNMMLIANEVHDDATLIDMMKEYAVKRENIKHMFKLL